MATITELMLSIRENRVLFYHKDTNQFDGWPCSAIEMENMDENAQIPFEDEDTNNFRLPSYEEVNHQDIMRFFVRECIEEKEIRKALFDTLRRGDYIDAYINKLRELNLYDEFDMVCGDIYLQIFEEWAKENGLNFWNEEETETI